ncbi:hypothetical protein ACFLY9_02515 [Patescibacteria group bacterium]
MNKKKLFLILLIFFSIDLLAISFFVFRYIKDRSDTEKKENDRGQTESSKLAVPIPSGLIGPEDFIYKGAFRLPQEALSEARSWSWGGSAATYYPKGDPSGESDSYPGSIFATGNDIYQYIAEFSIPVPIISEAKDVSELNTAQMLQDFTDIRGNMFGELELPRVGLEYLPKQGSQDSDKLYYTWGQHLQEYDEGVSHGWFDLDLSQPNVQGPWSVSERIKYEITDYIFTIPDNWADEYLNGMKLATGRFRDGGQGAQGPSIIAYAPWLDDSLPEESSELSNTPLLLYSSVYEDPGAEYALENYHHSDMWSGGAWITTSDKSAVIIAGIKGKGDCWYGYQDGTVWPEEGPFPDEGVGERGWWSDDFASQILFYDTADLAKVANGEMESYEPQPYAVMEFDEVFFNIPEDELWFLGAASYDRENNILYIFEYRGDSENDGPIVHVWKIG